MAFWGIKILPEVTAEIVALTAKIKQICHAENDKIVWEHPDDYHLTLKFFEQPSIDLLCRMEPLLQELAAGYEPLEFDLQGVGLFERKRGDVLWLGVEPEAVAHLSALSREINRRLAGIGVCEEVKPFVPHVTLARAQQLSVQVKDHLADFGSWHAAHAVSTRRLDYMKRRKPPVSGSGIYESCSTIFLG